MAILDKIYDYPVKATINNASDIQKGLLYVYGYDKSSFEDFKTGLMNQHNLTNVEEVIWIKPQRRNKAKPLILSFRRDLPAFIDVPGESMRTRVRLFRTTNPLPQLLTVWPQQKRLSRFC